MDLTVIIPSYNEAAKITVDLQTAKDYLEAQSYRSEVIVVDDGSSDGTADVVTQEIANLCSEKVRFALLSYGRNRGKGYAVRYGMMRGQGKYLAFMDVGLCVPLKFLADGMACLAGGADVAIGSRRVSGSRIERAQPTYRQIGSKIFGKVVRGAMGISVSDTQCGFKLYTSDAARAIFSRVRTEGFMFDIEALLVASRLGLRVKEFPVEWRNDSDSRYHPLWGTIRNFKELAKIRMRTLYGN